MPFFKKIRKSPKFEWTKECQKAFNELKDYLSSPRILSRLVDGEDLYIYLVASDQTVSVVLIKEEDEI